MDDIRRIRHTANHFKRLQSFAEGWESNLDSVDIHAHYFPKTVLKKLGQEDPRIATELKTNGLVIELQIGKHEYSGKVSPGFIDSEEIVSDTKKQGVSKRVLSLAPESLFYEFPAELAAEACRRCNDFVADLAEKHRDILAAMACVPLQSPDAAAAELERSVRDLGLKGVEIAPNVNGKNFDDKSFSVFFKKVEQLGVPIFVHPLYVASAERLANYNLENYCGLPIETTVGAATIIFGGVLRDYPNLKIILAHAGGFLPYQIGRFDHGFLARADSRTRIQEKPSTYFKKLYFDTITHNRDALNFLILKAGVDHVVMGSDYPFDMAYDDPVGVVQSLDMDSSAKEIIGGETARKLFRL